MSWAEKDRPLLVTPQHIELYDFILVNPQHWPKQTKKEKREKQERRERREKQIEQ